MARAGNPVAEVVLRSRERGLIPSCAAPDQRAGSANRRTVRSETTGADDRGIAAPTLRDRAATAQSSIGVVTMRALLYNGVNLDGSQIVDSRITIVADDLRPAAYRSFGSVDR